MDNLDFNAGMDTGFGTDDGFGGMGFGTGNDLGNVPNTGAKLGDIPLSQIDGLQNSQYDSIDSAKEAIYSMDKEELARRAECSRAFQWVSTIVDKANWYTNEKGNRVRKSSKFLGWAAITADTSGGIEYFTDAELLSYIAANGSPNGRIGVGEDGLRLNHSVRENKNAKVGGFARTSVFSLTPLEKGVSKFSEEKVIEAKEPVWEDDAKTIPKTRLKPGKRKDSPETSENYSQVWAFKPGFEKFENKSNRKGKAAEEKSRTAFETLILVNGTNPQASFF